MNELPTERAVVSAIIISFNTRVMTLDCLRSLFAQIGDIPTEVLVVDNASTDGSVEAVQQEFPEVKVIANAKNVGFGAANNQAMAQARGEYFLLLNSDAFLADGALPTLLAFLRREPKVGVVGPRLLNADKSLQCSCYHFTTPLRCWAENFGISMFFPRHPTLGTYRYLDQSRDHDVDFVIGACLLVRRAMYQQIGGFDELFFMYQEEADWQKRAWEAGWRVVYTPTAQAVHLGGASGKDEPVRINRFFYESLDKYLLKHHGFSGFLSMRSAMSLGGSLRVAGWCLAALSPTWRSKALNRVQVLSWLVRRQGVTGFASYLLTMNPLILLGGIIYAAVFWMVCSFQPRMALMLIIAASPFQYDISGGGPARFSLAEINLLLSLPLVLVSGRRLHFGPTLIPAIFYLLVGLMCSLVHWRDSTLTSLVQIALYLIVVVFVFATLAKGWEDYRFAFHGLLVVCLFLAVSICILRTPYLFGIHKNGIGGSLATAAVASFAFWLCEVRPKYRLAYALTTGVLVLGTIATLSRGAWMGGILGVLVVLALRREFTLMLRVGLVMIPIVMIGWFALPSESREYAAGFDAKRWNIEARYKNIEAAKEAFRSSPIFGVGVGYRKESDATNIYYITLAETGYEGVFAVLLVNLTVGWMVWRAHGKLPPRSLGFALVAVAGGMVLGKLAHGMVDHYWSRGSLTVAWAAVGMATRVAYDQRVLLKRAAKAKALARKEKWLAQQNAVNPVGQQSVAAL